MENYISGPMWGRIEEIRDNIWDAAIHFLESASLSKDILHITYYWTAYCFCISHILKKQNFTKELNENYIAHALHAFGIYQRDEEAVQMVTEFQNDVYGSLEELNIDISNPFDTYKIIKLGEIACTDVDPEKIQLDIGLTIEFVSCLADLTKSVVKTLDKPLARPCLKEDRQIKYNPPPSWPASKSTKKTMDMLNDIIENKNEDWINHQTDTDFESYIGSMLLVVFAFIIIILLLFC